LFIALWGLGHNYFHKKDSFLRYIFDLTSLSAYEWRITHAISHHHYANSHWDYEVTSLEPFLVFLSTTKKNFFQKNLVVIYYQVIFFAAFILDFQKKIASTILGQSRKLRLENSIVVAQLIFLVYFSGTKGIIQWIIMHSICSWGITTFGLPVHHHPRAWHDGEKLNPLDKDGKCDYGLFIVETTLDHSITIDISLKLLLYAGLNEHVIHHLFPTIDLSRFEEIRPIFQKVCKQFNVPYTLSTWKDLYTGTLRKLFSPSIKK